MVYIDKAIYCNFGNGSTTGHFSLPTWAANTTYAVGQIIRRATVTSNAERVLVCIVSGTSGATEPSWSTTRGAKFTDGTVTWQECSGAAGLNGDVVNTPSWNDSNAVVMSLGQVIKNNAGTHYFICSTAGTCGTSEPSWTTTAGATTTDGTTVWTCLGAVGNFSAWGAPVARLLYAASTSFSRANLVIFVGSNHAETIATIVFIYGVSGAQTYIYCVNSTVVNPGSGDLRTTASLAITTSGLSTVNGGLYIYGLSISADASIISANSGQLPVTFKNCAFNPTGATFGVQLSNCIIDNSPVTFASTTQTIAYGTGITRWINTPNPIRGVIPTSVFTFNSSGAIVELRGLDLSAVGSGKTLFTPSANYQPSRLTLVGCKLSSAVTLFGGFNSNTRRNIVDVINSDSAATNYLMSRGMTEGTLTTETTIVRTGGATDGTTPVSWKIVTSSLSNWTFPFDCPQMTIWNDVTGSNVVVTVYGIWGGASVPNNDDIWMEVDYTGSTLTPQMTTLQLTKATPLNAGAALASDTSTWGGSVTPFKLTTTLSSPQPGLKGPIYIRVRCAKPSTTFYIDPKPVLS